MIVTFTIPQASSVEIEELYINGKTVKEFCVSGNMAQCRVEYSMIATIDGQRISLTSLPDKEEV